MGLEGRKTILVSLGIALFTAGAAIAAAMAGAIADAPAHRDLTVLTVVLILGLVMLGAGAYIFAAAMSETLWLPGMKAVREASREHALAVMILTRAVRQGNAYLAQDEPDTQEKVDEISLWVKSTLGLVEVLWGEREEAIIRGGVRDIEFAPGVAFHASILRPLLERLDLFLARCGGIPLLTRGQRVEAQAWAKFFENWPNEKIPGSPKNRPRRSQGQAPSPASEPPQTPDQS